MLVLSASMPWVAYYLLIVFYAFKLFNDFSLYHFTKITIIFIKSKLFFYSIIYIFMHDFLRKYLIACSAFLVLIKVKCFVRKLCYKICSLLYLINSSKRNMTNFRGYQRVEYYFKTHWLIFFWFVTIKS